MAFDADKITFNVHGAGGEVGRSCFTLTTSNTKVILDCGVKLGEETEYPINPELITDADLAIISHAHLDHTGYLPLAYKQGLRCPVVLTSATKAITKILLKDSFNIDRMEHHKPEYSKEDIYGVQSLMKKARYNKLYEGAIKYKFYDAGHIPGSASIVLQIGNKNILYTGDINTQETRLMHKANLKVEEEIDTLIMESTYGDRNHPARKEQEKDFKQNIKNTLRKGGRVLIPVFAVGRAQEILLMLADTNFKVPVYFDGMAKKVTESILRESDYIKEPKKLSKAYRRVKIVRRAYQRTQIAREPGIFITTSGMMEGGPVIDYLKYLWHDDKTAILLTGYQAEHTNGRLLLESNTVFIDGWKTKVKCFVKKYDFSAHADQQGLIEIARKVNPKKIILIHGDPECRSELAGILSKNYEIISPVNGESFQI